MPTWTSILTKTERKLWTQRASNLVLVAEKWHTIYQYGTQGLLYLAKAKGKDVGIGET